MPPSPRALLWCWVSLDALWRLRRACWLLMLRGRRVKLDTGPGTNNPHASAPRPAPPYYRPSVREMPPMVPLLDFGSFPRGCASSDAAPTPAQLETARQVDAVCRAHGFCVLHNVGLDSVDLAFKEARQLFDLSPDAKLQLSEVDKKTGANTGYLGVRSHSFSLLVCAR